MTPDVTVVVATRNRREQLLQTLARHEAPVVVVDNGSTDGGPDAIEHAYPSVKVIRLPRNLGAGGARNVGVRYAGSRFVAFADDDSFWEAGALSRAVGLFDRYPAAALLTGRVLVGREGRLDPISAGMATAPLGCPRELPGPAALGFLGCAAVVRRDVFLSVGGFAERLHTYGEEEMLALDLAAAGWGLSYVDELVVRHMPCTHGRTPAARDVQQARNALLTAWMRRPLSVALQRAAGAVGTRRGRRALGAALRELPWVVANRRPVPEPVEAALRRLAHATGPVGS